MTACCFTGHRGLPPEKIKQLMFNLDHAIESLIEKGVTDFISGGAIGFDQLAASLIVAKKETRKDIRLIFALPCKNQEAFWSEKQKRHYQNLLSKADEIVYVSQQYDSFCMKKRNKYMVAHSAYCICVLLKEKSGTGQTVRFAKEAGLQVINVAT